MTNKLHIFQVHKQVAFYNTSLMSLDAYSFAPTVALLRGPSGAGKTRLLFRAARQGEFVIPVNCGVEGVLKVPTALEDIQNTLQGPWKAGFDSLMYKEVFSAIVVHLNL